MHKGLHSSDNIERQYVSRKGRVRGLVSLEDSVNTSIQRLEDDIIKRRGKTDYND